MKEFFPFRLDTANQCLWRGKTQVPIRPKAFAVLSYLVGHPGRLVTQNELLEALWPDTFVQPEVLKSHILEVRAALGDSPKQPSFIETLPRRGYRFIKEVTATAGQESVPDVEPRVRIIGRERELEELHICLRRACAGEIQVLFGTGEAGIGKTTLADAFTREARERIPGIRVARGQCVEGYGVQEPYYPVLMALAKLLREEEELVALLAAHAPTWLVQFPGLLKAEHRQTLQREILGATRQRMLRELCEVLPMISAQQPLLLLLEDIHWADAATVDLIATIAHSRGPARLLLMATYRPVEVVLSQHPLKTVKQDLAVHRLCQELAIGPLGEVEVAQYLTAQSPGHSLPLGLAGLMHWFSEGNPLFLRAALDHLLACGHLSCAEGGWSVNVPLAEIEMEVPESLRQMLELQVERLSKDERQALEAASVCGVFFLAGIGAAAGEFDLEKYEAICQRLAQQGQFLRAASNGYQFVHAFYRQAIYDRLPPQRRSRLHLRVGESLEALYSEAPGKIASELALHFEAGCDWSRAAKYLQLAAGNKGQRFAYREAASDLERVLELLAKLPVAQGAAAELEVMQKLGSIYFALEDPSRAILTLENVARRAALAGDSLTEINVLVQMGIILGRASVPQAVNIAKRLFELCDREKDAVLRARARMGALMLQLVAGESDEHDAQQFRTELAQVRSYVDPRALAAHSSEYALFQFLSSRYQDSIHTLEENLPILVEAGDIRHRAGLAFLIMGFIFCGDWGKALRTAQHAIATAQKNGNHRWEYALRLYQAWPHLFAQDWSGGLELCEAALPMLSDPYQAMFLRQGRILAGTALACLGKYELASESLSQARDGMDTEPVVLNSYWKMPLQSALTELSLQRGNLEQARIEVQRFIESSLATAERTWQALAWESAARVALAGSDLLDGQNCIRKAIAAMQGFDLPIASWRVHATAIQLLPETAEDHRQLAASGILRLAESLKEFPSLQQTFLSSKSVRSATLPKAISGEMPAALAWQSWSKRPIGA